MSLTWRSFILIMIAGVIFVVTRAFAKDVSLQWTPIAGATKYEMKIESNGMVVVQKKVSDPDWSGVLKFGVYTLQVRAIDRLDMPGKWSEPIPLVVMANPPELLSPAPRKHYRYFNPKLHTLLEWKRVAWIDKYFLQVTKDGKKYLSQEVNGTQYDLGPLAEGEYSWSVAPMMEPTDRSPASFRGKHWKGSHSKPQSFEVEQDLLEKPKVVRPTGTLPSVGLKKMRLEWKRVVGAEAYEVTFQQIFSDRKLASTARETKIYTADDFVVVDVPVEGKFKWSVRALAHVGLVQKPNTPVTLDRKPGAIGPESASEFVLDPNLAIHEGSGYVALSTMLAPFSYEVVSPANGARGTTSSMAGTFRLSGEYWLWPKWGVAAGVQDTIYSFNGEQFGRFDFELLGKYILELGNKNLGWSLLPKGGLEGRQYLSITRGNASTKLTTLGANFGIDIRKQFTKRWSVGAKLSYFFPLTVSGVTDAKLTSDYSYRNISFGLQGVYWLKPGWGLSAGAFVEQRSVSYTSAMNPDSSNPEMVKTDGAFFFGSLIYSFGQ